MKKVILMMLSLAMVLSSMITVSAEETTILDNDYSFIDIAYNGSGTYVAMAKNTTLASAKVYYSDNDGLTWQPCNNQPSGLIGGAAISSNPSSQQQLVWWADKGIFVAHSATASYVTADGKTWSGNNGLKWSSASMSAVTGNFLIYGANQKARATNNANAASISGNVWDITSNKNYYVKTIAAKPADSDGNIEVFINGLNYAYDLQYNTLTDTWSQVSTNSGNTTMYPYDMIYAGNAEQFLSVDASETLLAAKNSQYVSKYVIKPGVNVTGIGANDTYIVAGMSDGTMYYTLNTEITGDTVWTEIPAIPGAAACSEPIKNIEFSNDGSFVALGTTQIYKADINGYCNINEYGTLPEVTEPEAVGDAFTSGDGYWAKTAVFTLKSNGKAVNGVTVKVNDQKQTKEVANIEGSDIKFGIVVMGDSEEEVANANMTAEIVTE